MVAALTAASLTKLQLWSYIGIDVLSTAAFEDLRQVTSTADCVRTQVGWNISFGSCDPWKRPYNYPEVWARTFATLGLGEAQASYIGYSLIALFALSLTALTLVARRHRRDWAVVAAVSLAGVSPPSLFAMERGNIDIVVFALSVASMVLLARRASGLAAIMAGTAVMLKLFPIGLIGMFAASRTRRTEGLVAFGLISASGFVLLGTQLSWILSGTPQTAIQSFGAAVPLLGLTDLIGRSIEFSTARAIGLAASTIVFASICVLVHIRRKTSLVGRVDVLVRAIAQDDGSRCAVLGGGGCVLIAFAGGSSWDYRLIFLIPVLAGLLRVRRSAPQAAWICISGVAALLVVTYPVGRQLEPLLGFIWLVLAPALASLMLSVLTVDFPQQRAGIRRIDAREIARGQALPPQGGGAGRSPSPRSTAAGATSQGIESLPASESNAR